MNITIKEKQILSVIKSIEEPETTCTFNVVKTVYKDFTPKGFVGVVNSLNKKGLINKINEEGKTYQHLRTPLTLEGLLMIDTL